MRPIRWSVVTLFTMATSIALIGCASTDAFSQRAWRVEPEYKLTAGRDRASSSAFLALGRAYQGEGRLQNAADAFAKAAANDPSDPDCYSALGVALAAMGRHDAAISAFIRALKLAPDQAPLLNNLGYVLMLDGQFERAIAYLHAAVASDPTHERARENLEMAETQLALEKAANPASLVARADELPSTASLSSAHEAVYPALQGSTASLPRAAFVAVPFGKALEVLPPASVYGQAPQPISGPMTVPIVGPVPSDDATASTRSQPLGPTFEPTTRPFQAMTALKYEIANGNGVTGAAARMRAYLFGTQPGRSAVRLIDLRPFSTAHTQVQYADGFREAAVVVASRMPTSAEIVPFSGTARPDVRIVLGRDVVPTRGAQLADDKTVDASASWSRLTANRD